jgi:hypothetical protein
VSWLQYASDEVTSRFTTAGIRTTSDPRNVSPPCALVNPPSFELMAQGVVRCTVNVTLIAPGPANADAAKSLMAMGDLAISVNNTISGQPGSIVIGASEYPTYELTVEIAVAE